MSPRVTPESRVNDLVWEFAQSMLSRTEGQANVERSHYAKEHVDPFFRVCAVQYPEIAALKDTFVAAALNEVDERLRRAS